ncbi:MAG: phage portal protein [Elusimicrobiaceae bacterium]|nr:phage portal protein [Elusimicrobiaceae bacterium]
MPEERSTTNQEQPVTLADLFKGNNQEALINELKKGRLDAVPNAELYARQLEPEGHDVMDPIKRKDRWVKTDPADPNQVAGDEDTRDPDRTIKVTETAQDGTTWRREKVARVAVALQKLIVKRAVAFLFGNPVLLDAEPEGEQEKAVLQALKKALKQTKSQTLNRKIARQIFSATEAAELWYTVPAPKNNLYGFEANFKLRTLIFSPLKGDTLYPYFDATGDLVAFSREFSIKDANGVERKYFETYTAEATYRWLNQNDGWKLIEGFPKKNSLGKIPVIYGRQPETEWADVQGLIDRLEKLLSNFAETNDYHASPKIVTKGNIVSFAKKGEAGAVIEMDPDGDAHYMTWDQAPNSVKLEIETLLRLIYTITQTPDISWESVKGLNVSGVALRLMFMDAHLKVEDKMEVFGEYLQRRYSVVQAFLKQMNAGNKQFGDACDSLTVEPIVKPFMLEDEKEKVEILMAATGQKAIASRRNAVERLGWVDDTDAEIDAIEADEETGAFQDITEPTL